MDTPRQQTPAADKTPVQGGVKSTEKKGDVRDPEAGGGMLNQGEDVVPPNDGQGGMIGEG